MINKSDRRLVQCGRDFSEAELELILDIVELYPTLSLSELVLTIGENLEWYSCSGTLKHDACLKLLKKLELQGLLKLPEKQIQAKNRIKTELLLVLPKLEEPIECGLRDLGSVDLVLAREKEEITLWKSYVNQYHYLGNTRPFGCFMRYFIESKRGKLGCLLFSGAAKSLLDRDQWIGWSYEERLRNLGFLVNNTRFLIFPWVKVKNLASHVLGQVERRIGDDWERQWNYRPVLLETFVDPERYSGTCYQAANWHYLGLTTGIGKPRKGKIYTTSVKKIYVRPLADDFRTNLCS